MAPNFSLSSLTTILGVLGASLIIQFLVQLYNHRRRIRDWVSSATLRKVHGTNGYQPKPPWNPILGNLPTLGKAEAAFPPQVHPHAFPHWIRQQYPELPPVFYLDIWYASPTMSRALELT